MRNAKGDVEVALSAAAAGAEVVRSAYGGLHIRHVKSETDFVTEAEIAAERAILAVIAAARPSDTRIAEESGEVDGAGSRRWLVDPLCGTLNFAAHTPLAAINIALLDASSSLACVSADPMADEYFWSDGSSAFLRRDDSDQPLHPSAETRLVDVNCDGPGDRSFVGPQLLGDTAFRATFGPRVLSTTLALAWVAAGRRAAYVSDGFLYDNVHFAAGIALCRSAGCVVTDLAGETLHAGRGLIAAADAETHRTLVDLIRPHLSEVLR